MTPTLEGRLKTTDFMRPLAFLPLVAASFLVLAPALASAESFDFEDLPVRTVVNAQYGARGVIFFGAYIDNDPHARSGTRVLRSRSLNEEVFTPAPFVMTFTSPQAHVAMHASNLPGATGNGTLKVFDASGRLLAQDGPKPVPNDSFNAFFEVRVGTANITRAELQLEGTAFEAIDDLVVEGSQPPPPPAPPVVTITAPLEGAVIRQGSVAIRGTVVGDSVLDTMVLRIKMGLPGDSTAPPSENAVVLSGTGTRRTFSLDYGLIAGPYTVTALATNTANLQGSATIHFSVPLVSCPAKRVVDIKASTDPDTRHHQRDVLKTALATDGTTVRLGPDVDLDFSDLPADFFPLDFGRCVTLTSVSAFRDVVPSPPAAGTGISRDAESAPALEISRPGDAAGVTEVRTPRSLGPVLRYGPHRDGAQTFLQVRCFPDGAANDGARISGFRLFGPDFGNQSTDEVGIRVVRCVDIEISNMEIAGWANDGIAIEDDPGPDHSSDTNGPGGRIMNPDQVRIHDNFLHHNQHPNSGGHAEGYGVNVGHGAWARISQNVFDFNRHAIATPGDTGGYIAERNLVLKGGGYHGASFNTYTHIFDVHGTGCWWSKDLCGDAGIQFWFTENAFQYHKDHAIHIRGKPAKKAYIAQNIFPHADLENFWGDGAIKLRTSENVDIGPGNVTNFDSFGKYGVCDFDGDGVDDLFLATGVTWWFSSFGEFHWTYLNAHTERLDQLRLGYFDDDLRCDVLAEQDGEWVISSGGSGNWRSLGAFGAPLSEVAFGRFDPSQRDHRPGATLRTTHAFRRAPDGQWFVTPLSSPDWKPVGSSSFPMKQLRFGDFTGDGVTDVLAVENGHWAISESATGPWRRLNSTLGDAVGNLFIANMDQNDNIDDILRLERQSQAQGNGLPGRVTLTWWRSKNGTEPWRKWKDYVFEFIDSPEVVPPEFGFAGRFGAAPGGGTLVIDQNRLGHFYSAAEIAAGAAPDWTSLFPY